MLVVAIVGVTDEYRNFVHAVIIGGRFGILRPINENAGSPLARKTKVKHQHPYSVTLLN
jgi:hypothetical protein